MRSAFNQLRGQVAATAAAGAPASSFPSPHPWSLAPPRTPALSFFVSAPRALNPVISDRCRAADFCPVCGGPCYLLLRPVTSPVTAKSLFRQGLRGLLPVTAQSGPYDVRASASAHAPISLYFYGNIGNNRHYSIVSRGWALLSLLPAAPIAGTSVTGCATGAGGARGRNIIGGGYAVGRAGGVDLHRAAGGARRKFSAPGAIGGGLELLGLVGQARIRNGGFLPFSGGAAATVGRVALEGSGQGLGAARFSAPRRKLSRLARRPEGRRLASSAEATPPPPFARGRPPSTLRLDVFRISDRLPATPSRDRVQTGPERALSSSARTGSGVSGFGRADLGPGAERGTFGAGERVGDKRASSGGSGRPVDAAKLHRGGVHVN